MKGAIFIALNEMIEREYGMGAWLDLLDKANSNGVYTSTKHYPDEELFEIVGHFCDRYQIELPNALRVFGDFLFHFLHKAHPVFADSKPDFFSFIGSIDGVIHVEVHKLDENAKPPRITLESIEGNRAVLNYFSERKLCYLAEGLLTGAAAHYGLKIEIEQTRCMHDGAESCEFNLVCLS